MSEALLTTQTPGENTIHSPEEITTAFEDAQRLFYKFTADQSIQAKIIERGLDPFEDTNKPAYWGTVAELGLGIVARNKANGHDSLKQSAFELLVATPNYVFSELTLSSDIATSNPQYVNALQASCEYNEILRRFVLAHPEIKPTSLSMSLLKTINMAVEDRKTALSAPHEINAAIIGTQHENGFSQLVEATGRRYRHSSTEEDLQGVDYYIQSKRRPEQDIAVDVKGSLSEIDSINPTDKPYAIKSNGKIIMYSLLRSSDFGDSFFVGEDVVALKAPALDSILDNAEYERLSA